MEELILEVESSDYRSKLYFKWSLLNLDVEFALEYWADGIMAASKDLLYGGDYEALDVPKSWDFSWMNGYSSNSTATS